VGGCGATNSFLCCVGAVSGDRADLRAVPGRFHSVFFRRKSSRFPCLRMAAFSGITLYRLYTCTSTRLEFEDGL